MDIAATFFKNVSPDVREIFISERDQVLPMPPTENNHQGNQTLLLVRNAAVEAEKNIKTIKAAVKPASRSHHPKTFIRMLTGNHSTKMSGLGSRF